MTNSSLLIYDAASMKTAREQIKQGSVLLEQAIVRLRSEADDALKRGPWSVMDKTLVPPSGDKHDYMSVGIYWWPNPDCPDGLPYVHRDGQINTDYGASDGGALQQLTKTVETLGLAFYFTQEAHYAVRAAHLVRTWFLDEKTYMNPHLKFAQAVPGRSAGRSYGIIDTSQTFPVLLNSVMMLESSTSWQPHDQKSLKSWMSKYLEWLLHSDLGKEAAVQPNNHSTWYDLQVAALAIFTDEPEVAKRVLHQVKEKIIARQIEPDGRQPQELKRTRAFTYSIVNLLGLFHLATLAERFDIDLWNFKTRDGRSIRGALDWLAPFADPKVRWPYVEIMPETHRPSLWMMLRRASIIFSDARYEEILNSLPQKSIASERFQLLYPPPQSRQMSVE